MAPSINRRSLLVAGAVAAVSVAQSGAAQSTVVRGAVTFENGAAIPKGRLEVSLEDRAVDGFRGAATRLESDGRATAIEFALDRGAEPGDARTLRVVARLERAEDGWLVARGTAPVEADGPVEVTLNPVTY